MNWRARAGIVVAIMALLTQAFPAQAVHFDGYNAGNWEVWFQQCNLHPTIHWAFHKNDDHDVDDGPAGPAGTDIDTRKDDTDHSDCGEIIDVRIFEYFDYANKRPGFYQCLTWVADSTPPPDTSCNQGIVGLNRANSSIPESGDHTMQTMCQEVGHALGMDHYEDNPPEGDGYGDHPDGSNGSCMLNPVDGNRRHLITHDIATIDFYHNPSPLD